MNVSSYLKELRECLKEFAYPWENATVEYNTGFKLFTIKLMTFQNGEQYRKNTALTAEYMDQGMVGASHVVGQVLLQFRAYIMEQQMRKRP